LLCHLPNIIVTGDLDKTDDIKLSQNDLKAVNQMYKTIFDEIIAIGKDTDISLKS